jgi:hypothetical protein
MQASVITDRSGRRRRSAAHRPAGAAVACWDGPRIMVVLAAIASAALAVALSSTVFSRLSVNNDETVYLLQAKAMASGHLFPPVGHPAASFTPWLGVIHGGHYVLKYTPVTAAVFAVFILLTGGYVTGLAAIAAALVGATFLLAKEVTRSRGTAATAALLLAVSPVTIVQSALALPYLLFLVIVELSMWALLTGGRRHRYRTLSFAGLCAGLAIADRAYDALLILTPLVGWLVWRARNNRLRTTGAVLAGSAVPGLALLWFNNAATGSPFRLPFSLFESADTIGFGVHRVYPGESGRHFGLGQGWQGLARHLSLLRGGWAVGGLLLLALACLALVRRRASAACIVVLSGGVLLVVGYLFFWGSWNAAIIWGGVRYLGPYYLLPCLVPLSILGALGLEEVAASKAWKAVLVGLVGVAISAVTLGRALAVDAQLNAANDELAETVAAQGTSLVFVDTYPTGYLQHPTSVISNRVPPGGRTVYALEHGRDDFTVLRSYPGRRLLRLRLLGEYGKQPHSGYGAELERVALVSGHTLTLRVAVRLPASLSTGRLVGSIGATDRSWSLQRHSASVVVTVSGGHPAGAASRSPILHVQPGTGDAVFTLVGRRGNQDGEQPLARVTLPLSVDPAGRLRALVPSGVVADLGPLAPPSISLRQDASSSR